MAFGVRRNRTPAGGGAPVGRIWISALFLLSLGVAFAVGTFSREATVPGPEYARHAGASLDAAEFLDREGRRGIANAAIVERLKPSVVSIHGSGPDRTTRGTGLIFDAQGYVLTNLHVVEGLQSIVVTLSSHERYRGRLVGTDRPTDLAVIHIQTGGDNVAPATFGDSEQLQVGEDVLAIGNALGLGGTVTKGIISSLHRSHVRINGDSEGQRYRDFIQTDAEINPGNSGGPLVDMLGRVIGINSLIAGEDAGRSGVGFATPANDALFVARQLMVRGRVIRGSIGVSGEDVRSLTRYERRRRGIPFLSGVLLTEIVAGSAAEKAGLLVGDVILALNGRNIPDTQYLRSRIARTPISSMVELQVLRSGSELTILTGIDRKTAS